MTTFYPLGRIEECLPVEYGTDSNDSTSHEKPRVLHLEFYRHLSRAIETGKVKLYSPSGRLLPIDALGTTRELYLYPKKITQWFEDMRFPYSWKPEKIAALTLNDLKKSGALEKDCVAAAALLKARGTPLNQINKEKVAEEVNKMPGYGDFSADTLYNRIRKWW